MSIALEKQICELQKKIAIMKANEEELQRKISIMKANEKENRKIEEWEGVYVYVAGLSMFRTHIGDNIGSVKVFTSLEEAEQHDYRHHSRHPRITKILVGSKYKTNIHFWP